MQLTPLLGASWFHEKTHIQASGNNLSLYPKLLGHLMQLVDCEFAEFLNTYFHASMYIHTDITSYDFQG